MMADPDSNVPDTALLNGWQKRIAAGAITALGITILIAALTGLFFLLRGFVLQFTSVIWPLAVAGILALILRPVVHLFERALRVGRLGGIILLFLIGIIVILGTVAYLTPVLLRQSLNLFEILPELLRSLYFAIDERYPDITRFFADRLSAEYLEEYGRQVVAHLREISAFALPAVQRLGGWIASSAAIVTGVAIVPVYLFFFLLTDRDPTRDLDSQLSFVKPDYRNDIVFLIREFARIMVAFFRGQILIALIMGVLLAIGFSLIGLDFGIVLGLGIGALNVIPYLGTIVGLASCLPVAYLQPEGGFELMLMTGLVFAAVQVIEGYVLTPKIMGSRTGLHPVAIIIAIFFWGTALGGILGMILAIPLTAFFVVAWRLIRLKYLTPERDRNVTAIECQ